MTEPGDGRVLADPVDDRGMPARGDVRALLHRVADEASEWLEGIGERPVGPAVGPYEMAVSVALADEPAPIDDVIAQLVREAAPGLTAMASPRYFGFVIGGAHPVAVAAEWLVSAWDQNAGWPARRRRSSRSRPSPAPGWSTCSGCRRARRSRS